MSALLLINPQTQVTQLAAQSQKKMTESRRAAGLKVEYLSIQVRQRFECRGRGGGGGGVRDLPAAGIRDVQA